MTEGTDQQTSYEETISFKSDPKSIELCTKGLVEKFNSPVQGIDVRIHTVLIMDIESFWTEDNAGQTPNIGRELAIYVLQL